MTNASGYWLVANGQIYVGRNLYFQNKIFNPVC